MNDNIYFNGKAHELMAWCTVCGHEVKIPCTKRQYDDLTGRKRLIQDIFPKVPAGDREIFLSGWCSVCYDGELGYFRQASEGLNKMADEYIRKNVPESALAGLGLRLTDQPLTVNDLYALYCEVSNAADEDDENMKEYCELAKKLRSAMFDFTGMIENEELEEGE